MTCNNPSIFYLLFVYLKRVSLSIIIQKPHGMHGEYCACSKWGLTPAMGCPNPARQLSIIK